MPEGSNFKEDMEIDKHNLDTEWERQPALYAKYSALSAHANRLVARASEKVKTVRSRLILEALSGNIAELGPKPTGPASEAYYRSHADYKKAKEEWATCVFEAEQLNNAMFGLNNRKAALENLVKLQLNNYYSRTMTSPAEVGGAAAEKLGEQTKAAEKKVVTDKIRGRRNRTTKTEED